MITVWHLTTLTINDISLVYIWIHSLYSCAILPPSYRKTIPDDWRDRAFNLLSEKFSAFIPRQSPSEGVEQAITARVLISSRRFTGQWLHCVRGSMGCILCGQHHWNGNIFILIIFLSMAALEVDKLTTFRTASDQNFVKILTFSFQWCYLIPVRVIIDRHFYFGPN